MEDSTDAKVPEIISGFTVLPLHIPPIPSFPQSTTHYVYIQPHKPKTYQPDSQRSLYLCNVPVDSTIHHFRSIFSNQLGGFRVDRVDFGEARLSTKVVKQAPTTKKGKKRKRTPQDEEEKPQLELPDTWDREIHTSGSSAVCVFVDDKSARGAMRAITGAVKKKRQIEWGGKDVDSKVPPLGSKRYQRHYELQRPPHEVLQKVADEFMTAFGEYEALQAKKRARLRSEPDEDGFITVTRGGKEAPARVEETQERLKKQRQREKEKAEGMADFYRFQNRERKKAAQKELLRKFDEDRKKVEDMRQAKGSRAAFSPM